MDQRPDLMIISETAARPPRRAALLVAGMSRSGTSMLAHLLHRLGAGLPDDILGAGPGNPLGHWEPRGLGALNDAILAAMDMRWDDPNPLPTDWFRSRAAYPFLEAVAAQIRRDYADVPLALIKDPRLARLLPLYTAALDMIEIEPLVVLPVREPAEILRSLVARDGLEEGLAELLWIRSVLEAEWHSRLCRRIWTRMDDILTDWRVETLRIERGLGIVWPRPSDATEDPARVINPRQHHAAACWGHEGMRLSRLGDLVWAAIERSLTDDDGARPEFDAARRILRDSDRLYGPALRRARSEANSAVAAMRASTSWRVTAPLRAMRRLIGSHRRVSTPIGA